MERSLHSLRSVEMTYCVVLFRQNRSPFRPFVANHSPCRNKRTKKSVNPLGLAQNPLTFASVLIHIAFGFSYLVSDFLFHIELICLLERERGLQGCKPRSLFLIFGELTPIPRCLHDYSISAALLMGCRAFVI